MKLRIESPAAVLGYGVEGQAAVEFLKAQGISDITVFDKKTDLELAEGIKSELGITGEPNLTGFKTIIRSPGFRYNGSAKVTSMTDLTLDMARDRLTAITGSNGKTTTTGMCEAILRARYAGKIIVGGNDRLTVLQQALDIPDQPVLMEVSSFQFFDLHKSPHVSAILNITPNHLDWHENLEEYAHAKGNLIAHQNANDWAVLNAANENCRKLSKAAPGKIFWLNSKEGNAWVIWEDDILIAKFGAEAFEVLKKDDIKIKTHPDNILCAVAAGLIHETEPEVIRKALMEFKGMPQRLEFVREIDGAKFYNDSSCTTPESAQVALGQFEDGKLILMMGGSSKKSEFSFLAHHVVEHKARVLLYGLEGPRIGEAIVAEGGASQIIEVCETKDFTEIILKAKTAAKPGDSVVLSPACASFDMFQNSKQRGKLFTEIVNSL